MTREPEYRALLAVDIERSAGRGDGALLRIREVLRTALREAFGQSGIDWDACLHHDLGDGFCVTAPAGVRKARLIHPLVPELAVRLSAHNRLAGPLTRIRVRVALHAGEVSFDPYGVAVGRPYELLARLLDAAPAREGLAQAPEEVPLALIASGHFYEETAHQGLPGVDPDAFRRVAVTAKEYVGDAWLSVSAPRVSAPPGGPSGPGLSTEGPDSPAPEAPGPAAPDPEVPESAEDAPAEGRSTMVNRASGHGVVNATQHGTQYIRITRKG